MRTRPARRAAVTVAAFAVAWLLGGGATLMGMIAPRSQSSGMAVTADGAVAIVNGESGTLDLSAASQPLRRVWHMPLEFEPAQIAALGSSVVVVCVSKASGQSAVWTVDSGGRAIRIKLPEKIGTGLITAIAAAADGRSLYMASADGEVFQVDDRLSTVIASRRLFDVRPGVMAVNRAGLIAAADNQRGGIALYDQTQPPKNLTVAKGAFVASLAFSPDGRSLYAASGSEPAFERIDVKTGASVPVRTAGFVPAALAVAADGSIWAMERGGQRLTRYLASGMPAESRDLTAKR